MMQVKILTHAGQSASATAGIIQAATARGKGRLPGGRCRSPGFPRWQDLDHLHGPSSRSCGAFISTTIRIAGRARILNHQRQHTKPVLRTVSIPLSMDVIILPRRHLEMILVVSVFQAALAKLATWIPARHLSTNKRTRLGVSSRQGVKAHLTWYFSTCLCLFSPSLFCADYLIDTKDAHAFIQFKISHLGYSWILGRFNHFSGHFSYDEDDPASSRIEVVVQTASIDTNHAERDRHLRGGKFLDVERYPEARFVGTSYTTQADGRALLSGNLTLRGITRPIRISITPIGAGMDPWGGYRRGFEGKTRLRLKDFGIDYDLGPSATEVELELVVEGIRQANLPRHPKR
jgi:polyisoprenoid-binding protein YceI